MKKAWFAGLLLAGVMLSAHAAEKVLYPRPESANDPRTEYPVKLLELAFSKAGAQYEPAPSKGTMPQGRAMNEVATHSGLVQVVWTMTAKDREQELLPIRIPIYKGLIGWRLALVMKQSADQFKGVKTLADMKSFAAGQGHDWPDTEILRSNGLKVTGSPDYEGLFKMLADSRFNYFPRSVAEIWAEAESHAGEGIVVDQHIVMHYPAAFYYFVSKEDTKLAEAIRSGLEKSIADGSFDKLFHQYNDAVIKRSALESRTILELNNPLLPPETPLARKELWFSPK